ncbi:MAG: hypothetical protein JNL69_12835, partial [Bacteroidia bacterium]|nr:hypothetical protein [Bacteroidia bacterium]
NVEGLAFLNENLGDTLCFVSSTGSRIQFVIIEKTLSGSFPKPCQVAEVTCFCHSCTSFAQIVAKSDSVRGGNDQIVISITTDDLIGNDASKIMFSAYDNYSTLVFKPQIKPSYEDSLLLSLTANGNTYNNVISHTVDTLMAGQEMVDIYKTYFNTSVGFVGFYDRKTRAFYWRED